MNRNLADYIYNDLSPEEVVEMESEISADPQLSVSYRLNMQVRDYLQAKIQLEEMKSDPQLEDAEKLADMAFDLESMDRDDRVIHSGGNKRSRIIHLVLTSGIAATVAIILALGIIPSFLDQDRLFDHYYAPIEASDYSQRGVSDDLYENMARGINNYSDGNYRQSIDLFNALAADPVFLPEVHFFTGLSYLGLGQYQDAQNILESLTDGNSRYRPEALWYLSLCYLKTGDFEKAGTVLGELELYDGIYKEDAQVLSKKVRRLK